MNDIEEKMLPQDVDTEKVVLATLMRNNDLYMEYGEKLDESMFYNSGNRVIYLCIKGVLDAGNITDINSLYTYYLEHKNTLDEKNYWREITKYDFAQVFQKSNVQSFQQDVERLRNFGRRRVAWEQLTKAAQKVLTLTDDFTESVEEVCGNLQKMNTEDEGICSFKDALKDLSEIVTDNQKGKRIYLKTGFSLFDNYYLLRPMTLTVIAAFTSVGKSSLAMNISVNVAKNGSGVAYYSLEMGKAELASRVISRDAYVPASIIMNRQLNDYEIKGFDTAVGMNKELPIYIDERSTVSFDKTIASIRMMKEKKDIKLAVIDYLQIYTQVGDNTESSLAYMARAAKNIAKECELAVILISQLNRSDSHPNIKMLRGSGQIEESADNIVLIDRPAAYPDGKVKKYEGEFQDEPTEGTAKLILSKGRGVGTGCSLVGFDGRYTQFYELKKDEKKNENNYPF